MIKCGFCGHEFDEKDGVAACGCCPLHITCDKSKCPKCGFEISKEPAIIKFIKRKWSEYND